VIWWKKLEGNIVLATRTKYGLVLVTVLVNFGTLCFLGMVHQRAPIDATQEITRILHRDHTTSTPGKLYSVHFLMGCHATPSYSHLHVRGIQVEAWHLDCSPTCRASDTLICESDAFLSAPQAFLANTYSQSKDCIMEQQETDECIIGKNKRPPDFLAMFANDATKLASSVADMGLKEENRFLHTISGIRIGKRIQIGSISCGCRSLSEMIDVCFEEIVLYSRHDGRQDH